MKKCITCGIEKPISEFSRARANKPYLMRLCKSCQSAKQHTRYMENRDTWLAWQREYVASRPEENRIRHRKAHERRMQDPEWLERQRARNRAYQQANRDKKNARQRLRNERIAACEVNDFTPEQWQEMVVAYRGRCAYCGVAGLKLQTDHVIPLARGGNHTASNIVPSCSPCNLKKWIRTDIHPLISPEPTHHDSH